MRIRGTDQNSFEVILSSKFRSGEILSTPDNINIEVEKYICESSSLADNYIHKVLEPALIGEELEIALKHYKLLKDWGF